jgi:glyoxylase-like metal-dependent hydrolase (beta-lactamase superfamily II)
MSLEFRVLPVTAFEQNCTLVWCTETMRGAVIDPGGDVARILAMVDEAGVTLEKILLTHAHVDHAGGTADLAEQRELPIEGPHQGDKFWIEQIEEQGQQMGFPGARFFEPTRWLNDGDTVSVGDETLQVLHCPGHTPGHVVFYHPQQRVAQVGDVIFQGSVGRTDFPGGDANALVHSIRNKLFPLGDEVTFIPGHGPLSTFGNERQSNPFVGDSKFI